MNAKEVVIVSGVRTAIGTMGGTLKDYHQHDLGGKVIEEAVKRAGIEPKLVDEVIVGNVGQIAPVASDIFSGHGNSLMNFLTS